MKKYFWAGKFRAKSRGYWCNTECRYPEIKCNQNDWDYKLCYTLHLIRINFLTVWEKSDNGGQKEGASCISGVLEGEGHKKCLTYF